MPRIIIALCPDARRRADLVRCAFNGAAQIPLRPFVQHVEAPGPRPGCAALEEVAPRLQRKLAADVSFQRWGPVAHLPFDAATQWPAQPILPWKREGSLRPRPCKGRHIALH